MPIPILETKLYIAPIRPEMVPRPSLIERLNAGLQRKLTLVSAPAGSGKSTLVSAWLQGGDRPYTWLSLDAGDNDPVRFLSHLVDLQRPAHPVFQAMLRDGVIIRPLTFVGAPSCIRITIGLEAENERAIQSLERALQGTEEPG